MRLYHRRNEIAIDLSDMDAVAGIDIHFSGNMIADSLLPSDWQLMANDNRIICISFGATNPEILFNYTGSIKINGVMVYGRDLKRTGVPIVVEGIDRWTSHKGIFDSDGSSWGDLGQTHEAPLSGVRGAVIVRKNLLTNSNEFFFKDGLPYEGEYHQHQDAQAMTGSEHTEESIEIYRKDEKGKILDLRKGVSLRRLSKIATSLKEEEIPRPPKTREPKTGRDIAREEGATGGTGGGGTGGY
jgi:hypothetical protein